MRLDGTIRIWWVSCLPAVCCLTGPSGWAQRPGQGAAVEESAPINNLIQRASEGIDRQDWKLAIDSLQRIIDEPQGALMQREPGLYESSRRFAERTLSGLPPQGLASYRLLYDGQASRLFEQAPEAEALRSSARAEARGSAER